MASPALPAIDQLSKLPSGVQGAVLDTLFEPSEDLRRLIVPIMQDHSFGDYAELIALVKSHLETLLRESRQLSLLDSILRCHPRLGEKKVDSAQSRAEQAQLQSQDEGEAQELAQANRDYETAFPGLRYVVFVNGRSRSNLVEEIRLRIQRHEFRQERIDAIQAICDIAGDRAQKLSL